MSPAGTMMRVYMALKRRIMEGSLVQGARLDPARLQDELSSSTTPIRDALHRLTGEGLVESWQNEGFRVSQVGEPEIRDLYDWCHELAHLCLSPAGRHADARNVGKLGGHYADEVARLLHLTAGLSANHEHRRAMANLSDRSFLLRVIEEPLLDDPFSDLRQIASAIDRRDWPAARGAFDRFHGRRIAIVPEIAAAARERAAAARPLIF